MKTLIFTIIATFLSFTLMAQIPQNISYQGVASVNDGEVLIGTLGIQIEVLDRDDEVLYKEEHTTTTSDYGVFSILIGEGDNKIGSFEGIYWVEGGHQVRIGVDKSGGNSYIELGVNELSSVPYALYGEDEDADPGNELQDLYYLPAGPGAIDLFLTKSDDSVRITMGLDKLTYKFHPVPHDPTGWAEVALLSDPANFILLDADPSNELQTLSSEEFVDVFGCIATDIILTDNGGNQQIATIYDTDPENEIERLESRIRTDIITQAEVTELKLVGKNGTLDSIIIYDTDHTNEIQTPLLTLQEGPNGTQGSFNLSKLSSPAITFPDLDPENELQDLSFSEGFIGISGGQGVEIPISPWTYITPMSINFDGYVSIENQVSCNGPGYFSNVTGTNNMFSNNFRTPSGDLTMNDNYVKLNDIMLNANGTIQCQTIVAEIKNFVMDHPEDETKEIYYVSLEGPEAGAYERGTAKLENGECFVKYSDHFKLVKGENTPTMILTPQSIDTYGLAVVEKKKDGFLVKELKGGTGDFQFDWEVKTVRNGFEDYKVIRDKK